MGTFRPGNIEQPADHDFYAIVLTSGVNYSFNVQSDLTPAGLLNPGLDVRDSGGKLLASDHNPAVPDAVLNFTATTSGTHFLDVSSDAGDTGQYQLIA
jgi:hypothetical protein